MRALIGRLLRRLVPTSPCDVELARLKAEHAELRARLAEEIASGEAWPAVCKEWHDRAAQGRA